MDTANSSSPFASFQRWWNCSILRLLVEEICNLPRRIQNTLTKTHLRFGYTLPVYPTFDSRESEGQGYEFLCACSEDIRKLHRDNHWAGCLDLELAGAAYQAGAHWAIHAFRKGTTQIRERSALETRGVSYLRPKSFRAKLFHHALRFARTTRYPEAKCLLLGKIFQVFTFSHPLKSVAHRCGRIRKPTQVKSYYLERRFNFARCKGLARTSDYCADRFRQSNSTALLLMQVSEASFRKGGLNISDVLFGIDDLYIQFIALRNKFVTLPYKLRQCSGQISFSHTLYIYRLHQGGTSKCTPNERGVKRILLWKT